MYFKKALQKSGVIFLSVLLFISGCVSSVDIGPGNAKTTAKSKTQSHPSRARTSLKKADNPATQDYFKTHPSEIPNRDNLWVDMRENFQLDHNENNPQVKAQIAWFLHNQGYLDRTARRAAPFMYYIYQEVKQRRLPAELVLLPIIESAYNPFSSSPAGAAGLWQIVPGTGRTFGLRQNFWYDGRRDIKTSTKAALDYLTYLQNFFGGNWLLAIAGYDTGQGNVAASIRRNARAGLNTDFWSLRLARETEAYIPRLLALAVIINDPKRFDVVLPPISNAPYLGEVEISPQITLDKAAALAGMNLPELKILNAGIRRRTLDPNQPYKLLLPIDRLAFFKRNMLSRHADSSADTNLWNRYKVEAGDTWKKIAAEFKTSASLIQAVNHINASIPPVNQILLIPENSSNETAVENAAEPEKIDFTAASASDALDAPDLSDAAQLDTAAMKIAEHRNIKETASIHSIKIHKTTHTVKHGETLSSIAKLYSLSASALARENHLPLHASLKSGMKLAIVQQKSSNSISAHIQHKTPVKHHQKNISHSAPKKTVSKKPAKT